VQFGEEKMSKSLGNLITIKEALSKYSADAIRIFILSSHYLSPLTYSEEALEAAQRGAERLWQADYREGRGAQLDWTERIRQHRQRFIEAMDDDFNTAQAVAVLFDLARDINRFGDEGYSVIHGQQLLVELSGVLGLTLKPPEKPALDAEPFIELLISTRTNLRQAKQFQLADEIRAKLEGLGIALEDTPKGTVWKHKK
jgi:cysteinyl-tRNA synthetase